MTTDLDLLQSYRNCRSCCRLLELYKTKILKSTTKCRKLGRNDFGLRVRSFVINVFRTFLCIRSFIPFSLPFLPSPVVSSSVSLSLCLPRWMCILLHVKTEPVTRSACLIHATRVTSFYVSYSPLLFLSFLFFFGSWKREGGQCLRQFRSNSVKILQYRCFQREVNVLSFINQQICTKLGYAAVRRM